VLPFLAPSPDVGADVGAADAAVLTAWACRLEAAQADVCALAARVRSMTAEAQTSGPVGEALAQLAERTAADVAALGHRIGRVARLLAAEAVAHRAAAAGLATWS
jgi:hypothetical protein